MSDFLESFNLSLSRLIFKSFIDAFILAFVDSAFVLDLELDCLELVLIICIFPYLYDRESATVKDSLIYCFVNCKENMKRGIIPPNKNQTRNALRKSPRISANYRPPLYPQRKKGYMRRGAPFWNFLHTSETYAQVKLLFFQYSATHRDRFGHTVLINAKLGLTLSLL